MARFIVIEGIDGAGGETQSKLLVKHLKEKGKQAERITFPEYDKPIGNFISEFLYKKHDFR